METLWRDPSPAGTWGSSESIRSGVHLSNSRKCSSVLYLLPFHPNWVPRWCPDKSATGDSLRSCTSNRCKGPCCKTSFCPKVHGRLEHVPASCRQQSQDHPP